MERGPQFKFEMEPQPRSPELQPPTFGDRLREEAKEWGKTGIKTWGPLAIGISLGVASAMYLKLNGVGETESLWGGVITGSTTLLITFIYLSRLADKISWLKPSPKFRNKQD